MFAGLWVCERQEPGGTHASSSDVTVAYGRQSTGPLPDADGGQRRAGRSGQVDRAQTRPRMIGRARAASAGRWMLGL